MLSHILNKVEKLKFWRIATRRAKSLVDDSPNRSASSTWIAVGTTWINGCSVKLDRLKYHSAHRRVSGEHNLLRRLARELKSFKRDKWLKFKYTSLSHFFNSQTLTDIILFIFLHFCSRFAWNFCSEQILELLCLLALQISAYKVKDVNSPILAKSGKVRVPQRHGSYGSSINCMFLVFDFVFVGYGLDFEVWIKNLSYWTTRRAGLSSLSGSTIHLILLRSPFVSSF
ncbi:hypothetical protein H5410_047010 [Solanum commersonii]|uniref:Uncharacterized protein n=1 Tax=Solanum commersonii TaxID=4109 RepID=A0A9J5XI04_SOLCO|nr:hypothetical protein H5410_047010 [Solanum commersonii]